MIEPFCSEYTKSFRAFDREPEIEKPKPCLYYKDLKQNFLPAEDSKTTYDPERDERIIKDLYSKRLKSTYQVSYSSSPGKKSFVIDPNDLEADQFMVYFNKYYGDKVEPVLRPVETFRRINGYCRFKYFYTGKSMYEETIGREAYNYFKRDYDLGKSRLYRKKQQALKNLKNFEKTGNNDEKENKKEEEEEEDKERRERKENVNKKENEVVEKINSNAEEDEEKIKEKMCLFCFKKYGNFCAPKMENLIANEDQK